MTLLLKYSDNTLAIKESKSRLETQIPLKEIDNDVWRTILLGLGTIEHYLGHWEVEESLPESATETDLVVRRV
jgi:hypothetical protein